MANRSSLRMRVLPRFPARIVGGAGLAVIQESLDLVVKPDFGALNVVPAIDNPDTTFFQGWDQSVDTYSRISFQNFIENIQGGLGAFQAARNSYYSVLDFIPSIYWEGIGNRTILTDLTSYIQEALNTLGVKGGVLIFPPGRYPHTAALFFGAAVGSYVPSGNSGNSDIHFMQGPTTDIIGIGFAELYCLSALDAQLTVQFQNGYLSPSYTSVQGFYFNGRGLANRGLKSKWTAHGSYVNNRFDGHLAVGLDHEGRAILNISRNTIRGPVNLSLGGGGDNFISFNDFYPIGGVGSVRKGINFGPSSGNSVVGHSNTFTLGPDYNTDNLNSDAIFIDTNNRNIKIFGVEFHGFQWGVRGVGSSRTGIRDVKVIDCHVFTGAQDNAGLIYMNKASDITVRGNQHNNIGTTTSIGRAIRMNDTENVQISENQIGGVTGIEAVRIEASDLVNIHDNMYNDAVRSANPTIVIDSSNRVKVQRETVKQSTAWSTIFLQENGTGTGNKFGDNDLSTSFTAPYNVANQNTDFVGDNVTFSTIAAPAANTTSYLGTNGNQASPNATNYVNGGTRKVAKKLVVASAAAPGVGETYTYTLMVDGVDTTLVAVISGNAAFSAFDLTHSAIVQSTSRIVVKLVTSTAAVATAHRVALVLVD